MFCFQCQETARGTGCTVRGVCGKEEETANLQDLIIYNCKGAAILAQEAKKGGIDKIEEAGRLITTALFTTITNANFDNDALVGWIQKLQAFKEALMVAMGSKLPAGLHDAALYINKDVSQFQEKAKTIGVLSTENEDVRSLREVVVLGSKGISAYAPGQLLSGV